MKVVSVINYKGGVGKTTVTSNLAAYVATQGKRVLMIDLDPQTNLTLSFLSSTVWQDEYANKTLKNFFTPIIQKRKKKISLASLIIPIESQGVRMGLISSHLELIDVDTELAGALGGTTAAVMTHNFLEVHSHLKAGISELKGDYDLVLIDCPPNFNTVVKNAIAASDFYLVPSKMDYLSTLGIEQLHRNSRKFIDTYNKYVKEVDDDDFKTISPAMLGIVPTMLAINAGAPIQANQHYIDLVKIKGYYLFPWIRHNNTLYAYAPDKGIPVILSPVTGPTEETVVGELQDLGKAFLNEVGV